jgi:HEPN domain-containing protein
MVALEKTVVYFTESADEDFAVAKQLFRSKNYGHCLFFCHLAIEKLFKAIIVLKTQEPPEYTHFLVRLAEQAGVPVNESQVAELKVITKFNISGRYDDEKREFHKLATPSYTQKYLTITEELFIWLKRDYLKK